MADRDFIIGKLNRLPVEMRPVFVEIFTEILSQMRLGHPKGEAPDPALNFGGAFYDVTTHATPGSQFTISHGFGRVPYLALPILPLDVEGATIVPITVDRVADDKRLYLTSTVASAPISIYVEG